VPDVVDASVLVIGGGAVGGVTAGLMADGVRRVVVLDANDEHVRRMRDPGLELDILGTERIVRLEATSVPEELEGPFDFALVTLKAPALDVALPPLRDLAESFVALGNGLVADRVAGLVGAERLIAGTVELGATNLGPGRLRQTTRNPFVIGELDGTRRPRTERLAEVLGAAGEVHITTNIRGQIWSKLLVNSAFSALGAVSGGLYRDVGAEPTGRRAIAAVWSEGHRIGIAQGLELARALGIDPGQITFDPKGPLTHATESAIDVVIGLAGATEASMLQDLKRGMLTEVDVINGAVVARAAELGLDAPRNARIVELVHAFERGELAPSPAHLAELTTG
jgi:2-dehydropantoate 2-reductase